MTTFADIFATQWATITGVVGETVTYTDAAGSDTTHTAVVIPRQDAQDLEANWEVRARQAEVHIDASSVAAITFTPRVDTITSAGGVTYTVLERNEGNGAVYVYQCERSEVESIALRGRVY